MKKIFLFLIFLALISTGVKAEETLYRLLESDDWREQDEALSVISKNFEIYKDDELVKQKMLQLLKNENERTKSLRRQKLTSPEPGRGEHNVGILAMVIRLKIPDSIELLLDSGVRGSGLRDAIVDEMMSSEDKDIEVLLSIKRRLTSEDIYYKGQRTLYSMVINEYLERKNGYIKPDRQKIVKETIQLALNSIDHFWKRYAIRTCKHFPDDADIVKEIKNISKTDTYLRKKFGKTFYPLREEALKVLAAWEEKGTSKP